MIGFVCFFCLMAELCDKEKYIVELCQKGKYEDALKEIIVVMEKNKSDVKMYIDFDDYIIRSLGSFKITKPSSEFMKWIKEEAKTNSHAENIYGLMYQYGYGMTIDHNIGYKLFEHSAKCGNYYAQHNVAVAYQYGEGIKKNLNEALRLLKINVERGLSFSCYTLGRLYLENDAYKDDLKALECFTETLLNGRYNNDAKVKINEILSNMKTVKELMNCYLQCSVLKDENNKLKEELEELKYRPPEVGGEGYYDAQRHFLEQSINVP